MVLFDQIIQVLAGADLHSTRKFAYRFQLSHRTMRGRVGVQSDLRGYTGALHRAAEKRFGGVDIPVPAEKEIHRLARFVDGAGQINPLPTNLIIGLIHPRVSADRPTLSPPSVS